MTGLANYDYLSGRTAPVRTPSEFSLRGRLSGLRLLTLFGLI